MSSVLPASADSQNKFEDLSGVDSTQFSNPYDALLEACQNDSVSLQGLCAVRMNSPLLGVHSEILIFVPFLFKLTNLEKPL